MKSKTRLLALLLAIVMLFCTSCDTVTQAGDYIKDFISSITGTTDPDEGGTETPPVEEEDGKHVVTFVTNGGSTVDPIKVEDNKRLSNLPTPTREGYKFLGWYTDEACTTMWNNITKVKEDVTLYAGWKEIYVFDRAAHSVTPEELVSWYTATPEEFDAAMDLVAQFEETGMTDLEAFEVVNDQFETAFYHLAEQMTIASVIYYCNMKDEAAQERHQSTTEMFRALQDAYNIACQNLLENSPYSDELFAEWSEESKQELRNYSSEIMELSNAINALEMEYDKLDSNTTPNYGEKVADIYKQMVILNNQLAAKFGYDNYYDYATERVYGRDYTAEDLTAYHGYVRTNIASKVADIYSAYQTKAGKLKGETQEIYDAFMNKSFDTYGYDNYVMMYLESLGDTNMGVAMRDVFENENCVFADSINSHPTAFQTWLYESEKPFCLFGSSGQESTTIIHEIGHYYAAYTNDDIGDYDLCETHSQGNEFLFMNYCSTKLPKSVYNTAMLYQLINTCGTITLASIVDQFEQKVYSLSTEELEAMTVEDFDAIMNDIKSASEYSSVLSLFIDPCEYWKMVAVSNPVYYVSYSVSAVASLNIYAMALEDSDAAMAAYMALVETEGIEDMGYVEALTAAGVANPFDEQSHRKIASLIDKFTKD